MNDKVVEFPNADTEWVPVKDDNCRWILDLPGGPFVVLPCVCGWPVEILQEQKLFKYQVTCTNCGKQTPEVINGRLIDVLILWNEMVDRDEKGSGTDTPSAL